MNNNTLLHRQVNPSWLQDGRPTSQAFKPFPKDGLRLSVYDGDLISPEAAWEHFTALLGYSSAGVLSVAVQECTALQLPAEPDPQPFPEHAVIRFDGCTINSQIDKKAKRLSVCASKRGWQYQAEADA